MAKKYKRINVLITEAQHERVVQGRVTFPYLSDLRQELHLRKG